MGCIDCGDVEYNDLVKEYGFELNFIMEFIMFKNINEF